MCYIYLKLIVPEDLEDHRLVLDVLHEALGHRDRDLDQGVRNRVFL
jgi:hypothetical protein